MIALPYEASKEYLYMQYRNSDILQTLKEVEKDYIQAKFYDVLNEYINAIDYQNTNNEYIFYWALKYLNLPSMWGTQQANTLYDTNIEYDTKEIYDNYSSLNAFIGVSEMKAYTSFLMNLNEQCLNLPHIVKFLADYTLCDMADFTIEISTGHITITIPNINESCLSLFGILTAQELVGMPYGANPIIWKYKGDNNE